MSKFQVLFIKYFLITKINFEKMFFCKMYHMMENILF